jgi:hypothetical protein
LVRETTGRYHPVRLSPHPGTGDAMKKKTATHGEALLIEILKENIRVKGGSLPTSCYDFKKTAHRKPMKYGLRRKVAK